MIDNTYHHIITPFFRRCFLWCPVHWYGRSCFIDGERFTGKHTFSIRQHHYLLEFGITRRLTLRFHCAVYSGCSVSVWLDQRATSWSLPTRNAIPHHKLSSEYILSPALPQTKKNKQQQQQQNTHSGNTSLSGFIWQGGLAGMIIGLAVTLWVWIGGQIYPASPEMTDPLPLTTVGCTNYTTVAPSTSPLTLHTPPR